MTFPHGGTLERNANEVYYQVADPRVADIVQALFHGEEDDCCEL